MKLELKKFDPSTIKHEAVCCFIGKRATGKSYCMRDILSYHKTIPIGMVISPTEIANKYFESFVPKMLIHDDYSPQILQKFMDRQKNINAKVNKDKDKNGYSTIDPKAFLILDDCLYDNSWTKDVHKTMFYEWSSLSNFLFNYYAVSFRNTTSFTFKH